MKFTADNDIKSLASTTLATLKAIADDSEKALAELDRDETSKPEVLEKKRQAVYDAAKERYGKARAELAVKADSAIREIRLLANHVKAPAPDPALLALLNVLNQSDYVTQLQIQQAAELADDDFSRDAIQNLIAKHGLQMPHYESKSQHLRKADLEKIADDLTGVFRFTFDNFSDFVPARAAGGTQMSTPEREISMLRGKRSNAEYSLQRLANGAAFQFESPTQQSEFQGLAATAEL